jgi:hypothetical protein
MALLIGPAAGDHDPQPAGGPWRDRRRPARCAPPAAVPGAAGAALPPAAAPAEPEFTARQALRTRAFWLLGLGHAFALLVVTSVNVHGITHMKEGLGYSVPQAALVVMALTDWPDRRHRPQRAAGGPLRKRNVAALCMFGHMLGMLLLTYATHPLAGGRLCRAARRGLGRARPLHAGDAGRLLRPQRDRHDHGPVGGDRRAGPDRRAAGGRHAGRPDRQLPARLHGAGADRRHRLVLFVFAVRPQRPGIAAKTRRRQTSDTQ